MSSYRTLPANYSQPEPDPIPAPAPAPTEPRPRRSRGGGVSALVLVGAVAFSAVGGGAVGATVGVRYLMPQQNASLATAMQPVSVAAPAAAQVAAVAPPAQMNVSPNNVAGAVYARVSPSVVQIVTAGQATRGPMRSGSGSGFVIDRRGYILTNNHVVEGGRAVSVRFVGGTTREAQIVGTDRGNDLAPLGDSDVVEVGETSIAIGSPFGLEQSVTQGIISAVQRTWAPGSGRVRRNLPQTDTPINPGNSGGPLLNARGEVIGINSMIESPVRGSVGVGFAVPINTARRLLPQLEAGARLEPVWLGISGQELDDTIARDLGLSVQRGILVTSTVPNGPAATAGLRGGQAGQNERIPRGGDVIVAVNGTAITSLLQLTETLNGRTPGEVITVRILRDGAERDVQVTLQAWPAENG